MKEEDFKASSPEQLDNKQYCLKAVSAYGYNFQHVSKRLYADKELAIAAVGDGFPLKYLDSTLRDDKEVALQAFKWVESNLSKDYFEIDRAGPKIQELCKDKDPVQALEAAIRMEKMQAELKPKPQPQKRGFKI